MKKILLLFAIFALGLQSVMAQTREITGKVTSVEDGTFMPGVTVAVKGTTIGTITNNDGTYNIRVPREAETLVFSFVGMKTQEVAITGTTVNVKLVPDVHGLEEVMVVAYGTSTKEAFTGSAGVIDSKELSKRQVSNITKALAGQVAGVQAYSSSGQPGTSNNIRIRGLGSYSSSNAPLYVVDGTPYTGGMESINPADIESVTVLKDASAAAIYGARGANGVVLITTKKGTSTEAVVTFDAKLGNNRHGVKRYDIMKDPAEWFETLYKTWYNQRMSTGYESAAAHVNVNNLLFSQDGGTGMKVYTIPEGELLIGTNGKLNPRATLGYSDDDWYYMPDDWYKESYNKQNLRQEYNFSVSGKSDKIGFYFGAGFIEDKGIIPHSDFNRYSGRLKVDYQAKEWLKLDLSMAYASVNTNYPGSQSGTSSANLFYIANYIAPVYPIYVRTTDKNKYVDSHGLTVYDYGDGRVTNQARSFMVQANPFAHLALNDEDYIYDVFAGKWSAEAEIIKGLKAKATLGLDLDNTSYTYKYNKYYGQYVATGGYISKERTRTTGLTQQYLATYKKTYNLHTIDLLAGYESYEYKYSYLYGNRSNIYNNDINELGNAIDDQKNNSSSNAYTTKGIIGRMQYDFDEKYYFSASFRRDASSRFHPDKRWGSFGSVGGAWIISKENFFNVDKVDMLKLKASWGLQGNDNLLYTTGSSNYYPYLDQYTLANSDGEFSTTLGYKGNQDITWETSYNFNVGAEFELFDGRLDGSVEYFSRKTVDMLYYLPVAPSAGYSSIPVNQGDMRNSGVELELSGAIINTNDITWRVNLNGTHIKNEILYLPEDPVISGDNIYRSGGSLYNYYFREYAGVDKETGKALFYKIKEGEGENVGKSEYELDDNGNKLTTDDWSNTGRRDQGSIIPKIYGGFGTSVDFYGFDFSLTFSYQLGGKVYDNAYSGTMHNGGTSFSGRNWHKDIHKAWTSENPNTDVPRLNATDLYTSSVSNRFLIKSDFLSLNNVTVGYTLPESFTKKVKINSMRFYVTGDNLAVFSKRKGLDPRQVLAGSAGNMTYSAIRTFSGGVSLTF